MDTSERDKVSAEQFKKRMERDFTNGATPERPLNPEHRIANALEYIAFQLGQINRKMDKLTEGGSPRESLAEQKRLLDEL